MSIEIPSALDVRAWLAPLSNAELQRLAEVSGVPFTTLWKVRSGETEDPRIETVRKLAPHVAGIQAA